MQIQHNKFKENTFYLLFTGNDIIISSLTAHVQSHSITGVNSCQFSLARLPSPLQPCPFCPNIKPKAILSSFKLICLHQCNLLIKFIQVFINILSFIQDAKHFGWNVPENISISWYELAHTVSSILINKCRFLELNRNIFNFIYYLYVVGKHLCWLFRTMLNH